MISISSFKPGSPPPSPPLLDPKNFRRFAAIFELFGAFYFFELSKVFFFICKLSSSELSILNPQLLEERRRRRENFWVRALRVQFVKGGSSLQAGRLRLYAARIPFARAVFKYTKVIVGGRGERRRRENFEIACCKLRSPIGK